MKKKIICASLLIIFTLLIIKNNAYDVKREYESLNKEKNYIKVVIPKDNPFQKINYYEFLSKIKETSVIFVGSSKNQKSRESINILSKVADNVGINKIYYIDINNIKSKKLIKKYNITKSTLLVFKNGKNISIINNKNEKKLKKEYEEAVSKTLVCNPSGDTC